MWPIRTNASKGILIYSIEVVTLYFRIKGNGLFRGKLASG